MTGFALGEVALGSLPTIPLALKVLGAAKTYCRNSLNATAHLGAKAFSVTFERSSATFNLALSGVLHAQMLAKVSAATSAALKGISVAKTYCSDSLTATTKLATRALSATFGLSSASRYAGLVANTLAQLVSRFSPPQMASSIGAHSLFKTSGFPMPSGTTILPSTRTTSTASGSAGNFILTRFFSALSNTISKAFNSASFVAGLIGRASGRTAALSNPPTGVLGLFTKAIGQVSSSVSAIGNTLLSAKAAAKDFAARTIVVPTIFLFANSLSINKAKLPQVSLSAIVMAAVGSAQSLARAAAANGKTQLLAHTIAAISSSPISSGVTSLIGRSESFVRSNALFINEKLLAAVSSAMTMARGGVKVVTALFVESSAIAMSTASPPSGVLGLIAHAASGVKGIATTVIVKSFHVVSSVTKTAGRASANYTAVMTVSASSVAKSVNQNIVGKASLLLRTSLVTAAKNIPTGSVQLLARTRSISEASVNQFLQSLFAAGRAFSRARSVMPEANLAMMARSLVATFISFGNKAPETIGRPVIGSGGADDVTGEVNNDQIEES